MELARRWRAGRLSASARHRPPSSPVVVGPELILSFNGTYRARARTHRSLLPATSYSLSVLGSRAPRSAAIRLDSIIDTELGDTLWPNTRFSGHTHLQRSPPSNPMVVWVSAELIAHEYHNQGCTLYRTRAAHHRTLPRTCTGANWVSSALRRGLSRPECRSQIAIRVTFDFHFVQPSFSLHYNMQSTRH